MAPLHSNEGFDAEYIPALRNLWTAQDDAVLIRVWLQIPRKISGFDWDRISAYVTDNTREYERNRNSCKNRWGIILRHVTKYISAMARAHSRATGDTPESEVVAMARRIYFKDEKIRFSFSHAYQLLRAEPKFINHISANRKEIFEFQLKPEDSSSEAEAGSKRSRLNEGGDHLLSSNPDILINGDPSSEKAVKEQDKGDERFKEGILSRLQLFRDINGKVDEWKEFKLQEMQISREIEELKVKKMEEKSRNSKYKVLDTLLRKETLSEFDEDLKNRLCAELFPK